MNHTYSISELSEEQFANFGSEWQECLRNSSSDPVFSSWPWCHSWWKTWACTYSLSLQLIVIKKDALTIGIAPLFKRSIRRVFGPNGDQLQFIGNIWRCSSIRSEYTNFIIRNGHEDDVCRMLSKYLRLKKWDDLIVCDHKPELLSTLSKLGVKITARGEDRGVSLNVSGKYSDWLESLSKKTRSKVYNKRNNYGDRLTIDRVDIDSYPSRESYFELLYNFHVARWNNRPEESLKSFHHYLAGYCGNYLYPIYSILRIDGEPVSVLTDIVADRRRYNLHVVYNPDYDSKVSLGMLHLGCAIQEAFEDINIDSYDLLAGEGKNSFYKESLRGNIGSEYMTMTSQISGNQLHALYLNIHLLARKVYNAFKKKGRLRQVSSQ